MRKAIIILYLICGISAAATAQFFNQGVESGRTRWNQIDTRQYRLIYPQGFDQGALRYSAILDTIYPWINYKLADTIRKIPIVLRTRNEQSNGFVTWAPKREEIVTNSQGNTYALSWSKQVAVHEARHVAQMSILRTGLTRVATWFLGEAGVSIGLMVVDKWQLEGDATLAETQFAEYGRGLQPEFTLGYRGIAAEGKLDLKTNNDPWLYGSYNKVIPDVYHYGYQVLSAAETYFSPTIWNDVVRYSARYPILIYPRNVYLRRHHGTTFEKLAVRAFAELDSVWRPTYQIQNSFSDVTPRHRIHTNYGNPIAHDGKIVATKWDMTRPWRLIEIDTATGREKLIMHTGSITSRPVIWGQKVFWTEHKPDLLYQQQNSSAIRSVDLNTGRREVFNRREANYYVTPMSDTTVATVTHDTQSNSYIRITDSKFQTVARTIKFTESTTLHGMTWDSTTQKLYYIALDDRGMWIGSATAEGVMEQVTAPSVVTVRDLSSDQGVLYFSSIQSGKNEIHSLDLTSGQEHRQTLSRLGSQAPTASGSQILFTSYTPRGWAIAQTEPKNLESVEWSRLPRNTLNPKRYQWEVPKIDSYQIAADTTHQSPTPRRFRKIGQGLSFHSWAPIPVQGDLTASDANAVLMALGATAFFQSTLSEVHGYASYGWVNNMNWLKSNIIYSGLPVQIDLTAEYGGGYQSIYLPSNAPRVIAQLDRNPYKSIAASFSLPLNLSKGASLRLLQPSLTLEHNNSRYYRPEQQSYGADVHLYTASLYWSSIRARGYRSLMPRLGYALRYSSIGALNHDFSKIDAFSARVYLPGVDPNHSISVAAVGQHQFEHKAYKLDSKTLVPRGLTNNYSAKNYAALRSGYFLPLAYPDGGFEGILYLRRISAELFYDFSRGEYYTNTTQERFMENHYSTGFTLGVENTFLGILPNTTYFTVSRNSVDKFWFGVSFSLNL